MTPARARLSVLLTLLAWCARASAVPLLDGFGGPTGYGLAEHCLHASDDGSYAGPAPTGAATPVSIDLREAFPEGFALFSTRFTQMFVNVNGNVTLHAPLASPTPVMFPQRDVPMIAPWWSDVDTRGGGQSARNNVCFHVERGRIVVTWHEVGTAFAPSPAANSFQMIVTTSRYCFGVVGENLEYRFARCDAMPPADTARWRTGFDAGDQRNYFALPLADARTLCTNSNVPGGPPGLWRFQITRTTYDVGSCEARPCAVPGALGACASGVSRCVGTQVICAPRMTASPRACNGRDNDCDGALDDDDALCAPAETCRRGRCIPRCDATRPCPANLACDARGACVEPSCAQTRCPMGEVCRDGRCGDPCEGMVCPEGLVCRGGRCADPCEDLRCGAEEVCEVDPATRAARCVLACQCRSCDPGSVCTVDGRCVHEPCADVTCPQGTRCEDGACVDRCLTRSGQRACASDEQCVRGECVPALPGERASDASVDREDATTLSDHGCGCRSAPRARGSAWWAIAVVLAAYRALYPRTSIYPPGGRSAHRRSGLRGLRMSRRGPSAIP